MANRPYITNFPYKFITSFFETENCQNLINQTITEGYCEPSDKGINSCCERLALERNVILDTCQDYISYSCDLNPDNETSNIIVVVCLVSATVLISGTIIYLCAKSMIKNKTRTEYTYIGNEDL